MVARPDLVARRTGPRPPTPSRQLLSAPGIPAWRLYSVGTTADTLAAFMQTRDQAARSAAMWTRRAEQLTNPKPLKLPKRQEATPAVPDVEQRGVRAAMARRLHPRLNFLRLRWS